MNKKSNLVSTNKEPNKTIVHDSKDKIKKEKTVEDIAGTADDGGMGIASTSGTKRKAESELAGEEVLPRRKVPVPVSPKKVKTSSSPSPSKAAAKSARAISATSNGTKSPAKSKSSGTQKITKFFGNSA